MTTPHIVVRKLTKTYRVPERYPVGLYPGWLRLVLTWIVPVGVMTTVPAEALTGTVSPGMLLGSGLLATALLVGASALFRFGLRRYASASS
jgi:ABC-2 type transport system permease protein